VTIKESYAECALVLRREIELLERIGGLQTEVKNAIANREWTGFEEIFASLVGLEDEFEALDLERVRAFAALAEDLGLDDGGADFYRCAARLPGAERQELPELYRQVKMRTLELRIAGEALAAYLGEIRTVINGFLEAVFPDRKGRIYTRRGTQASPDTLGMALNQSL
jgi:hypothetical protein